MAASIVLTGLGSDYPIPGTYVEINFAQGPAAGSGGPYTALIIANKLSTGSATADTVVYGPDTAIPCQRESDIIASCVPP